MFFVPIAGWQNYFLGFAPRLADLDSSLFIASEAVANATSVYNSSVPMRTPLTIWFNMGGSVVTNLASNMHALTYHSAHTAPIRASMVGARIARTYQCIRALFSPWRMHHRECYS